MNILRTATFPLRFLTKLTLFLVGLALVLGVGGAVGGVPLAANRRRTTLGGS